MTEELIPRAWPAQAVEALAALAGVEATSAARLAPCANAPGGSLGGTDASLSHAALIAAGARLVRGSARRHLDRRLRVVVVRLVDVVGHDDVQVQLESRSVPRRDDGRRVGLRVSAQVSDTLCICHVLGQAGGRRAKRRIVLGDNLNIRIRKGGCHCHQHPLERTVRADNLECVRYTRPELEHRPFDATVERLAIYKDLESSVGQAPVDDGAIVGGDQVESKRRRLTHMASSGTRREGRHHREGAAEEEKDRCGLDLHR